MTYSILTRSKPGQDAEFRRWYLDHHLPDVQKHPQVVRATLNEVIVQRDYGLGLAQYDFFAVYELDSEDAEATLASIQAHMQAIGSPMTDAMDFSTVLETVSREVASIG